MSRVEEIEQAIERLTPAEFAHVVQRVLDLDHSRWKDQLDRDAQAGKLDFLIDEARSERLDNRLQPWPSDS
ncbi:MAG: hypothetical protein SFV18_04580 [Bryobacteraceae bacterium]|nr:hypothetical protein [Bryobacteraceae bacterium]